jgi:hypothetical protein
MFILDRRRRFCLGHFLTQTITSYALLSFFSLFLIKPSHKKNILFNVSSALFSFTYGSLPLRFPGSRDQAEFEFAPHRPYHLDYRVRFADFFAFSKSVKAFGSENQLC